MLKRGEFGERTIVLKKIGQDIEASGDKEVFFGYRMGGEDSRHGVFSQWKFENDTLTFINDQFGFFPTYYYQDEDTFAISNAPLALLKIAKIKELDEAALAVFFRMEMFIGDMSPFKGIKALPPGVTLTYDSNGLSMVQDHVAKEGILRTDISLEDSITKFAELFQKAIEKYRDAGFKKIGVPLSGGRDSRHILLALDRAGIPVHSALTTKSQAPKPEEDSIIAAKVTEAMGVNHVIFDQPAVSLEQELEKNEVGNFICLHHSWILPLAHHLEENEFDVIFDGICGGTLSAGEFLEKKWHELYKQGKYEEIADDVLDDEGSLGKMIGVENQQKYSRELAVKTFAAELEKHKDANNPLAQFSLWNLSRRSGGASSWMLLHRNCNVIAPFLDPEVYEFLTSLPVEYFYDHTFHTKAISQFYPEYAHVPYENKNAPGRQVTKLEAVVQSTKMLFYYLKNLGNGSMIRDGFIIPRTIKSILFKSYYYQENSIHYMPIYLNDIERHLK